jgi:polysaccharide biosynthesis/export protein
MLRKLSLFLLLFIPLTSTYAQNVDELSDDQIRQFYEQALSSGMSEEDIAAAALAKGYQLSDINKMKDRIAKLKNGNGQAKTNAKTQDGERKLTGEGTETILKNAIESPDTTKRLRNLRIFGLSLFTNKNLSFEPNLRLPTPKNYIIGPDDELNIDITGYAYKHYTVKVTPEGTIQLESLSPIFVNGSTIEQAREKIINRLKTVFSGLNSQGGGLYADVTLGNIRSIKVTIIGEAFQPGTYTLPSLATAFNAIYSCGGVSDNGSLRSIEIHRNGKLIRVIDLYDFLLKGDKRDDIALQDQDIIRIPFYDIRIDVTGEVKSPLIYEVKKGETLKDIIGFAGSYSDSAYTKSVNVIRPTDIQKRIISVPQEEIAKFIPLKGDKLVVGAILNRLENKVTITGAIYRPGEYELEEGMTLKQLIQEAEGLRENAFKDRIIIKREKEALDKEVISLDLNKILKNETPDFKLVKRDSIFIKSFVELREKRVVNIEGAVGKPGAYTYYDNMTVGDVVTLAGGFLDGATATRIEIARRVKDDTLGLKPEQSIRVFFIDIAKGLQISNEDKKTILSPFDRVFVRRLSRYEEQRTVTITGEVFYPGSYAIKDKTERISDLIKKAGKTKSEADLASARFTRSGRVMGVDLVKIENNYNHVDNLLLAAGDALEVPRKKETVTINGQVLSPTTVPYDKELKFKDYLDRAGGFTDSAFVSKTYVRYANGYVSRTRKFFFIPIYPKVEQGMDIIVPTKKKIQKTASERIASASGLISIATVLILLINNLK